MYTSCFKKNNEFLTAVCAATVCMISSELSAKEIEYYCTDMSTLDWQSVEVSKQQPIAGYWRNILYGTQSISAFFVNESDYKYALSFCKEGWVVQPYSFYWLPFVVVKPDGSRYLTPFHFGDWSLHASIKSGDSRVDFNPPYRPISAEINFQLRV
jgi:hypothetical protein